MWEFVEVVDDTGYLTPTRQLYAPQTVPPKSFGEKVRRKHEAVDYYMAKNIEWFRKSLTRTKYHGSGCGGEQLRVHCQHF